MQLLDQGYLPVQLYKILLNFSSKWWYHFMLHQQSMGSLVFCFLSDIWWFETFLPLMSVKYLSIMAFFCIFLVISVRWASLMCLLAIYLLFSINCPSFCPFLKNRIVCFVLFDYLCIFIINTFPVISVENIFPRLTFALPLTIWHPLTNRDFKLQYGWIYQTYV